MSVRMAGPITPWATEKRPSVSSKPRLKVRFGIWDCATSMSKISRIVGYGYSPREAYDNWREQIEGHGVRS